jgi:hypothetical protein
VENYEPDLGRTPSKRSNKDPLITIMRDLLDEHAGASQETLVRLWIEAVHDHADYESELAREIDLYVANLVFLRCTAPAGPGRGNSTGSFERRVRDIVASQIMLATWVIPMVGKKLIDCTFAEVAEAAPTTGRFLIALAKQGAPGQKVKEVFPTEDALQSFWRKMQGEKS